MFGVVLASLRSHDLDSDDLRAVIVSELGEVHWFKSVVTEKYYPATVSDYYSCWIDEAGCRMFLKLLVVGLGSSEEMLVITSFKKDERYA